MSTNTLYIDTQNQEENFLFETTENTTPSLRVYIFNNGTAVSLSGTNTAKFIYAVNRESSEVVEIDADTITVGDTYIDFNFSVAQTSINGKFFATIILYDNSETDIVVQSDGMIILKQNPGTDSSTALDTTTVINWSQYTNTGLLPWSIGNDVTVSTDCSDSPKPVYATDSSTTFIHNADCDYIYELPKATTANIGRVYGFMNLKRAYTVTLQCQEGDTIDDSPATGIKYTIRNYDIPCSVMIRQVTATKYQTIWGDGAWATGAGEVSLSSSSSSSSSSSQSSVSSSSSSG